MYNFVVNKYIQIIYYCKYYDILRAQRKKPTILCGRVRKGFIHRTDGEVVRAKLDIFQSVKWTVSKSRLEMERMYRDLIFYFKI